MFNPGQDYNYPTSSGNVPAGMMSQQFSFLGIHLTFAMIAIAIGMVITYNLARRRR